MELKPQWNLIPIDLWFENCWWSFRAPYVLTICLWVRCGCVSLLPSKVDQITLMRGYTWYTTVNLKYLSLSLLHQDQKKKITLMRGYTWYTAVNLKYLSLSPPSRPKKENHSDEMIHLIHCCQSEVSPSLSSIKTNCTAVHCSTSFLCESCRCAIVTW